jgi:hypothetical protein
MHQPDDDNELAPPPRHWFDPVCAWLALAVPLCLTLWRASPSTQWRDDVAVVRGLGLVPFGGEGVPSTVLMQLAALLPIGGRLLRASLVSAIGVAVSAWLIYLLTRRVLEANAATPRLTPMLALSAALTATLAPTWQLEGTIAGGATLAAALALIGLLVRPRASARDKRVWVGFGALMAFAGLESHAAGLVLLAALIAQIASLRDVPDNRALGLFGAGAVGIAALCLVPYAVRPFAEHAWVHLGYGLSAADAMPLDVAAERTGAILAWLREIGVVSIGLAIGGAVFGLIRRKTRWIAVPLVVFVLADLAFPASRAGILVTDRLAAVRLLAVSALAIAGALGLHTVAIALRGARLPFARAASVMLVVFNFTLVLVTGEDSSFLADRRSQHAAEVWTDEALGSLPPRSLLLVRSEAVAWRLWANWVVRGERPDVVAAPLPLLERGSVAARLVELEPGLGPLVRELAINGQPTEYALSALADARPLFVEFDPSWEKRCFDHLVPQPLWLRFSPHALGRSDRAAALKRGRAAFRRVLGEAKQPAYKDAATIAVLSARGSEQAVLLAMLGDRHSAAALVEDLRLLDPNHAIAGEVEKRLHKDKHGRIDVAGLLPFEN